MTDPQPPRQNAWDWLFWFSLVLGTAFAVVVLRLLWALGSWLMR
jgi:hypothetical protein